MIITKIDKFDSEIVEIQYRIEDLIRHEYQIGFSTLK